MIRSMVRHVKNPAASWLCDCEYVTEASLCLFLGKYEINLTRTMLILFACEAVGRLSVDRSRLAVYAPVLNDG